MDSTSFIYCAPALRRRAAKVGITAYKSYHRINSIFPHHHSLILLIIYSTEAKEPQTRAKNQRMTQTGLWERPCIDCMYYMRILGKIHFT